MESTRRTFIKDVMIYGSTIPFLFSPLKTRAFGAKSDDLDIHIFSKHLQFLSLSELGGMAAEMGFNGVDLTVRPKGHILPDAVLEELPKAVKEIEAGGSRCPMITTSIESINNPLDQNILIAASQAGIEYYRTHWFKYFKEHSMPESLKIWQAEVKQLGDFNEKQHIIGCYQNHAGTKIGSSFWEIKQLLDTVNPRYFGTQYDIRHAIAEGGFSWENGLKLLQQQIKTIVLKDFKWGKVDGKWKPINVPIGEGMVDFSKYFSLLKAYQINVPASLHLEYPLGGAEKGRYEIKVDKKVVFDAMIKDLRAIRKLWREA